MVRSYVPARGDFVWLQFNPQTGHEQAGHRPALVLSPQEYNRTTGLALFCPVTSKEKGYPFEVLVEEGLKVKGAVLADQIKSLDWRARRVERISKVSSEVVAEVLAKAMTLLT